MQLLRAKHYESAELPTKKELESLGENQMVKVAISTGERFWCRLTSDKRQNGTFTAEVQTRPITEPTVRPGCLVVLEPCHVLEVI